MTISQSQKLKTLCAVVLSQNHVETFMLQQKLLMYVTVLEVFILLIYKQ